MFTSPVGSQESSQKPCRNYCACNADRKCSAVALTVLGFVVLASAIAAIVLISLSRGPSNALYFYSGVGCSVISALLLIPMALVSVKAAIPARNSDVVFSVPGDEVPSSSRGRIDGPLGDVEAEGPDLVVKFTNDMPATGLVSESSGLSGIASVKACCCNKKLKVSWDMSHLTIIDSDPSLAFERYQVRDKEIDQRWNMSRLFIIDPKQTESVQKCIREDQYAPFVKRSIASMLGMVIGDAQGAPYEFLPFKESRYSEDEKCDKFKLQPGQWTDDASMGLCLADVLINGEKGELNDAQLILSFYDWWNHGYNTPFTKGGYRGAVGLGGNISKALENMPEGLRRDGTQKSLPTTAGDKFTSGIGSIMRNSPVAIVARSVEQARALAAQQSRVTHQGEEAAACCELMAYVIYLAINDEETDPKQIKENLLRKLSEFSCSQASVNGLANSQAGVMNPKTMQEENWNWKDKNFTFSPERTQRQPGYIGSYVMDGMAMALHCVFTTNSFEEAVLKATRRGGDADSVGTVVAQIAGAIYGIEGIPQEWIDEVQQWDRGGEVAARAFLLTQ